MTAQRKALEARAKELGQQETALAATEAQVRTRETEAGKVSRAAADRIQEAEQNLKAIKERERQVEKAETRFKQTQEKLTEQAAAKDEAHTHDLDEARKAIQARDRELAVRAKQVQALESAAQAAEEARQRRELETKTESTRLKTQLDVEIHRTKSLAKDLEAARSRSVKASELATRESALRKQNTDLESREQAFRTAARLLAETGCTAVKLEGGAEMADTVRFLTERGVRLTIIWINRQSRAPLRDRLIDFTFLQKNTAEVVVSVSIVRLQLHRFL